jgi:hypothetical protein
VVVEAKGLVGEERVDEGLCGCLGAAEECVCTLNWVANGEAALLDPKGEEAAKVVVDGIGTAEDGGEEVGPEGFLDRREERSNVLDDAAGVVPLSREARDEAGIG